MNINISIPIKKRTSFPSENLEECSKELLPPNNVGAYVLRGEDNGALYVGMSTNLVNRLKDHVSGKGRSAEFSNKITAIDVYISENNTYADMMETYLIISEKPLYNIAKVPRESDDIKDLETELFDIDENIDLWKEQLNSLYHEVDAGYQAYLDQSSCIYADIQLLKTKIKHAEKRRKQLISKGAKPLENFSLLAHVESRQRSNAFYRKVFVHGAGGNKN